MATLIIVVLLTILISASCSLFEATLYSARRPTIEAEREDSRRRKIADSFLELKDNIGIPIAAILILNTVSNTGGATIAGMYAGEEFGHSFMPLFSICFTLAILLFSEIVPKTVGAVYWRNLWAFVVAPLRFMSFVLYPLVLLTQQLTDLLTRGTKTPEVTEEEILAAVRIGAKEGEITASESRLVHNIMALENKQIRSIMTPRTVIFSLEASTKVEDAVRAVDQKGFTRIPIFEGDPENIVGYIITHDLLSARTLAAPHEPIKSIAKPIEFVPETKDALGLLTMALSKRKHIFIVVDEYGGVSGLITLEDLLETLLGTEIVDETDKVVDLQETARKKRRQPPST